MSTSDDTAELRALQRKAYGREGSLTHAEAERLRELEDGVAGGVVPEEQGSSPSQVDLVGSRALAGSASPVERGISMEPGLSPRTQHPTPSDGEPPGVAVVEERPIEVSASLLRRHWKAAAAASAVLLALGVGAGWALFGQQDRGITLTTEQEERRLELYEDGFFDEGSIRGIASDDDAFVWYATTGDAERLCVILDVGDQSQRNCVLPEDIPMFGLQASVVVSTEAGANPVSSSSVNAYVLLSTAGEPMASIQRWDMDSSWTNGFEGEDRERVEELAGEGFDIGVSLVGQFRGEQVWVADRFTDEGGVEKCLIADAVDVTVCGPIDTALEEGLSVQSMGVDEKSGATTPQWELQVAFTQWQNPYLTITEHPQPANASEEATVEIAP